MTVGLAMTMLVAWRREALPVARRVDIDGEHRRCALKIEGDLFSFVLP
jgi:hypothetical protein